MNAATLKKALHKAEKALAAAREFDEFMILNACAPGDVFLAGEQRDSARESLAIACGIIESCFDQETRKARN